MNSKALICALGLGACTAALTSAFLAAGTAPAPNKTHTTLQTFPCVPAFGSAAASSAAQSRALFVIRLVGGQVCLFTAGHDDDCRVLASIDARTLRRADRLLLEQGIELSSQRELQAFLEDFGS